MIEAMLRDKYQLQLNMSGEDREADLEGDIALQPSKPKLKKPSMYNVVMHNDDYTPMEFVVHVLEVFFRLDREAATRVMLTVHTSGKAVCGTYTRDIAETKALMVNNFSQENEHPLKCEIEIAGQED